MQFFYILQIDYFHFFSLKAFDSHKITPTTIDNYALCTLNKKLDYGFCGLLISDDSKLGASIAGLH